MIYTIEIEFGETTCASAPGKFCRFVGAIRYGTLPICKLFAAELNADQNGWLARCDDCRRELKGRT